jgi:hypothetical protein
MIKKLAIMAIAGLMIYSCGQVKEKQSEGAELKLISELVSDPLGFENQEVSFEGVITHICKHSGDKMRVNQVSDNDYSIMVMLEEFQTQFSQEFEGKNVRVNGVLKTVVRNLDAIEHEHEHEHDGEEGHECASTEEAIQKLQEKGITPDIRAFIELKSYEIVDEIQEEEAAVEVAEAAKPGSCCAK